MRVRSGLVVVLLVLSALAATGCGGSDDSSASSDREKLLVIGYSVLGSVYENGLEPGFRETPEGEGFALRGHLFGPSGYESRAVEAGQEASVVHFSENGDMNRLVDAGLVSEDWDEQPYDGIAQNSVVVIMTRKGNPKNIHSFDDLLKKDLFVMTTNPFSSGFGRWSIMALYGSQLHQGKSEGEALDAVKKLFVTNAPIQAPSAYGAVDAFAFQGEADVVLAYESEAIRAEDEGADVEYVIPPSTILVEAPIAATKEVPAAQDFLDYVWSDEGQEVLAEYGYRPVNPELVDPKRFPVPRDLFTIAEFGGWGKVNHEFFDGQTGKVAQIEKELGVSTSGS